MTKDQVNKKYGFIKSFKVQCFKCEKVFEIEEREPQKHNHLINIKSKLPQKR